MIEEKSPLHDFLGNSFPEPGASTMTIPTSMTSKEIILPMSKASLSSSLMSQNYENKNYEEHFESKEKVERRNAEDFSHLKQQENAVQTSCSVLSKVTSDTTNIIMNRSSKEDENTEDKISADEEYLLRKQRTINFPERFSEWSDEQRKVAYDCNFKLYMEKFMETIPSLTTTQ